MSKLAEIFKQEIEEAGPEDRGMAFRACHNKLQEYNDQFVDPDEDLKFDSKIFNQAIKDYELESGKSLPVSARMQKNQNKKNRQKKISIAVYRLDVQKSKELLNKDDPSYEEQQMQWELKKQYNEGRFRNFKHEKYDPNQHLQNQDFKKILDKYRKEVIEKKDESEQEIMEKIINMGTEILIKASKEQTFLDRGQAWKILNNYHDDENELEATELKDMLTSSRSLFNMIIRQYESETETTLDYSEESKNKMNIKITVERMTAKEAKKYLIEQNEKLDSTCWQIFHFAKNGKWFNDKDFNIDDFIAFQVALDEKG